MFGTNWRRRRAAKAMAELRSRAVIRAAEELVGSAWITHLTERAPTAEIARQRLEWEQVTVAQASHSRAREAARDQRRLAEVRASLMAPPDESQPARVTRPVVSRPSESG